MKHLPNVHKKQYPRVIKQSKTIQKLLKQTRLLVISQCAFRLSAQRFWCAVRFLSGHLNQSATRVRLPANQRARSETWAKNKRFTWELNCSVMDWLIQRIDLRIFITKYKLKSYEIIKLNKKHCQCNCNLFYSFILVCTKLVYTRNILV